MVEWGFIPRDTVFNATSSGTFIITYTSDIVAYAPSLMFTKTGLYLGYLVTRQTKEEFLGDALNYVHKVNMVIDVFYDERGSDEEFGKVYIGETIIGNTIIARTTFNYSTYRFTFMKALVEDDKKAGE